MSGRAESEALADAIAGVELERRWAGLLRILPDSFLPEGWDALEREVRAIEAAAAREALAGVGGMERVLLLEALYDAVGAAPTTSDGTPRQRAVYDAWRAITDHDREASR